MTLWRLHTGLC